MSLVMEVAAQQAQSQPAEEHADIAMQFFNIMYTKKHPDHLTKSPGTVRTQRVIQSDCVEGEGLGPGQAAVDLVGQAPVQAAGAGQASVLAAGQAPVQAAGAGQASVLAAGQAPVQDRAQLIAQKLIEMGDSLEKNIELMKELKEAFEREFKLRSVFHMAYENFSGVCQRFLSQAGSRLSSGWDQVYFLYYGHYLVGEELIHHGGTRERVQTAAHYVDDFMHDVGLDEWVDAQGGMTHAGAGSEGSMVDVPLPVPQSEEGTSVDK